MKIPSCISLPFLFLIIILCICVVAMYIFKLNPGLRCWWVLYHEPLGGGGVEGRCVSQGWTEEGRPISVSRYG